MIRVLTQLFGTRILIVCFARFGVPFEPYQRNCQHRVALGAFNGLAVHVMWFG